MKKTENKEASKKAFTIGTLFILCIAILVGTYFLTREPENEFSPEPIVTDSATDTWDEQTGAEATGPTLSEQDTSQVSGTSSDDTQAIVSETETSTVTSLSDSTTKEESSGDKPSEKPVTAEDMSNPDKQPEYVSSVPQATERTDTPAVTDTPSADNSSGSSAHVYDPVFGWIDTGNTHQDSVDSSGSINNQIGSMN